MKKILFLFALTTLAFSSNVSGQANAPVRMTGTGDSLSNTATKYCTLHLLKSYDYISLQIVLTKASGTVAGTTIVEASLNDTAWFRIDTLAMTATNVTTNTKIWVIDHPQNYLHLRTATTGSGTMKVYLKGYALYRKD